MTFTSSFASLKRHYFFDKWPFEFGKWFYGHHRKCNVTFADYLRFVLCIKQTCTYTRVVRVCAYWCRCAFASVCVRRRCYTTDTFPRSDFAATHRTSSETPLKDNTSRIRASLSNPPRTRAKERNRNTLRLESVSRASVARSDRISHMRRPYVLCTPLFMYVRCNFDFSSLFQYFRRSNVATIARSPSRARPTDPLISFPVFLDRFLVSGFEITKLRPCTMAPEIGHKLGDNPLKGGLARRRPNPLVGRCAASKVHLGASEVATSFCASFGYPLCFAGCTCVRKSTCVDSKSRS